MPLFSQTAAVATLLSLLAGCSLIFQESNVGVAGESDAALGVQDAGVGDAPASHDGSPARIDAGPACQGCFVIVAEPKTWDAAREVCVSLGGDLASLVTIVEWLHVREIAVNHGATVWIGLTDIASEGIFRWVNGDVADLTSWREGEPDNGVTGQVEENCAAVLGGSLGVWEDHSCTEDMFHFVCELPEPP